MTQLRRAGTDDAERIATLHAESWRAHYRGAYDDTYLDGPVFDDLRARWIARMLEPSERAVTIVAEDAGALIGFAHTILDADATFGALLDNLHVAVDRKGGGLGRELMAATAQAILAEPTTVPGLYLWVLETNVAAQGFYRALGGTFADREVSDAPGGGAITGIRVAWPDPSTLLAPLRTRRTEGRA